MIAMVIMIVANAIKNMNSIPSQNKININSQDCFMESDKVSANCN